ncbi:hypothetical protein [Streptomyces sp. SP17KL33]|uniref:hypothetical protein n=1 Tax=Streptomyces sp. SP17KL33 TaxID=3002534 RepID=UPI002E7A32D4|nr:hypothetical protein [Streptomyces sp. SP17KL33]MEE1838126.1 hypothetical protein [Streptomyces sp. SP17KL33]
MWLLMTAAVLLGGIVSVWRAWHSMRRRFAAEHDRQERDLTSARAEVAQLRHGRALLLADALVVHTACTIVDNALRSSGSGQEQER